VVIDDLDVFCTSVPPLEADSPLIVHSNAVLPRPIPREPFQAIPRWDTKVVKRHRGIEQK